MTKAITRLNPDLAELLSRADQQLCDLHHELVKKYQQLERASDDLSMFMYITTNNLRQPIRQLYTSLEELIRTDGHVISNSGRAKLRKMQSSLNRINLLLADILSLSRINSFMIEGEMVDLNKVLQTVLSEDKLGARIRNSHASVQYEELPIVYGNKEMLESLIFQLLDNAIKFHQEGSKPVILVQATKEMIPQETNAPAKEFNCITISDNGMGIAEADQERIFNIFEKLHPENFRGSGLGLSICRRVMDAHEGYITVTSIPDKGSSFTCCFPLPE